MRYGGIINECILMKNMGKAKQFIKTNELIQELLHRYAYDHYPRLVCMSSGGDRRNRELSSLDLIKSKIWVKVAQKGALGGFYDDSRYKNKHLQEIKDSGFVIIENFLDSKLSRKYCSAFQVNDPLDSEYYESWTPLNKKIGADMIDKTILREIIGELNISRPYPRTLLNYVRANTSPLYKGVSDWHCDRYIPCLKGLYFPDGCDWMPFERLIMPTKDALSLPLSVMKTFFEDLPSQLSAESTYTAYVKPNTLILCMNAMFHRRSSKDEARPGKRKIVFMDWNHQFNRYDLLLSAVKRCLI